MSRRGATIFLLIVVGIGLAGIAGLLGWRWFGRRSAQPASSSAAANTPQGPHESVPVTLYFPGEGDRLYREEREVDAAPGPQARVRACLEALLQGPQTPGLLPVLPPGVTVGVVHLVAPATVYVDLRSEAAAPPSGGSLAERLTVYSLVNTVVLNVPETKRVAWLWNGTQLESFGGHLDARRPFGADPSLLAPTQ